MLNDKDTVSQSPAEGGLQEKQGSRALQLALDILSSLSRADLAVVPIMPSAKMLESGNKAGGTNNKETAAIYHTMVHTAH